MAGRYRIRSLTWWTKRVTRQEIAELQLLHPTDLVWVWHDHRCDSGEILLGLGITFRVYSWSGRASWKDEIVPGLACLEGWPLELLALFRGSAHVSEDLWLVVGPTGIATVQGILLTGVER